MLKPNYLMVVLYIPHSI